MKVVLDFSTNGLLKFLLNVAYGFAISVFIVLMVVIGMFLYNLWLNPVLVQSAQF